MGSLWDEYTGVAGTEKSPEVETEASGSFWGQYEEALASMSKDEKKTAEQIQKSSRPVRIRRMRGEKPTGERERPIYLPTDSPEVTAGKLIYETIVHPIDTIRSLSTGIVGGAHGVAKTGGTLIRGQGEAMEELSETDPEVIRAASEALMKTLPSVPAASIPGAGEATAWVANLFAKQHKKSPWLYKGLQKIGKDWETEVQKSSDFWTGGYQPTSPIGKLAYDVGGAVPSVAIALGSSYMGRPEVGMAVIGLMEKADAYERARAGGKSALEADQISTIIGVGNAILESYGATQLINRVPRKILNRTMKRIVTEGLEEALQGGFADVTLKSIKAEDKKWVDIFKDAAYQALIGAIAAGPVAGINSIAEKKTVARLKEFGLNDEQIESILDRVEGSAVKSVEDLVTSIPVNTERTRENIRKTKETPRDDLSPQSMEDLENTILKKGTNENLLDQIKFTEFWSKILDGKYGMTPEGALEIAQKETLDEADIQRYKALLFQKRREKMNEFLGVLGQIKDIRQMSEEEQVAEAMKYKDVWMQEIPADIKERILEHGEQYLRDHAALSDEDLKDIVAEVHNRRATAAEYERLTNKMKKISEYAQQRAFWENLKKMASPQEKKEMEFWEKDDEKYIEFWKSVVPADIKDLIIGEERENLLSNPKIVTEDERAAVLSYVHQYRSGLMGKEEVRSKLIEMNNEALREKYKGTVIEEIFPEGEKVELKDRPRLGKTKVYGFREYLKSTGKKIKIPKGVDQTEADFDLRGEIAALKEFDSSLVTTGDKGVPIEFFTDMLTEMGVLDPNNRERDLLNKLRDNAIFPDEANLEKQLQVEFEESGYMKAGEEFNMKFLDGKTIAKEAEQISLKGDKPIVKIRGITYDVTIGDGGLVTLTDGGVINAGPDDAVPIDGGFVGRRVTRKVHTPISELYLAVTPTENQNKSDYAEWLITFLKSYRETTGDTKMEDLGAMFEYAERLLNPENMTNQVSNPIQRAQIVGGKLREIRPEVDKLGLSKRNIKIARAAQILREDNLHKEDGDWEKLKKAGLVRTAEDGYGNKFSYVNTDDMFDMASFVNLKEKPSERQKREERAKTELSKEQQNILESNGLHYEGKAGGRIGISDKKTGSTSEIPEKEFTPENVKAEADKIRKTWERAHKEKPGKSKSAVDNLVDKLARGEKADTPEELQLYANNAKEIEKKLKEKAKGETSEPTTKSTTEPSPPPKVEPAFAVEEAGQPALVEEAGQPTGLTEEQRNVKRQRIRKIIHGEEEVVDQELMNILDESFKSGAIDSGELDKILDVVTRPKEAPKPTGSLDMEVEQKTDNRGNTYWLAKGPGTLKHKQMLKNIGGKWSHFEKGWRFYDGDPTPVIESKTGKRIGRAPKGQKPDDGSNEAVERDLRKRKRAQENERADERPTPENLEKYVDPDTHQAIFEGKKAGIPDEILTEQIHDAGLINWAYQSGKAMFTLASEAGSGKTYVLGAAIQQMKRAGAKRIVYVTNNVALIDQIKRDLVSFNIGNVEFVTYTGIRNQNLGKTDVLIFDEAQLIKNPASQQGLSAAKAIPNASFVVFASATPMENPAEAAYMEPTGVFDDAGGFEEWATAYGCAIKRSVMGGNVIYWPGKNNEAAKEARKWLMKRGVMTQRNMKIPKDMTDVSFKKVLVDKKWIELYGKVTESLNTWIEELKRKEPRLSYMMSAYRTNLQKRILEASKVQEGIKRAKEHLAKGKSVVVFVETKAERDIDTNEIISAVDAHLVSSGGSFRDAPYAKVVYMVARALNDFGVTHIRIDPSEEVISEALGGKNNVAIYTGSQTDVGAKKALEDWKSGKKKVLVATMAKGGTGLSLHDTAGNRPTAQVNINLPWRATGVAQVSGRVARYGIKSKAFIEWIFTDQIAFDKILADRVGQRMASMGAVIKGIDLKAADILGEFNFEDEQVEIAKTGKEEGFESKTDDLGLGVQATMPEKKIEKGPGKPRYQVLAEKREQFARLSEERKMLVAAIGTKADSVDGRKRLFRLDKQLKVLAEEISLIENQQDLFEKVKDEDQLTMFDVSVPRSAQTETNVPRGTRKMTWEQKQRAEGKKDIRRRQKGIEDIGDVLDRVFEGVVSHESYLYENMDITTREAAALDKLVRSKDETVAFAFIVEGRGLAKSLAGTEVERIFNSYMSREDADLVDRFNQAMRIYEASNARALAESTKAGVTSGKVDLGDIEGYITRIYDGVGRGKSQFPHGFIKRNRFFNQRTILNLVSAYDEYGLTLKEQRLGEIHKAHKSHTYKVISNKVFVDLAASLRKNGVPLNVVGARNAPKGWVSYRHPALKRWLFIPGPVKTGEKVSPDLTAVLEEMGVEIGRRINPKVFGVPTSIEGKYYPGDESTGRPPIIRLQRFFKIMTIGHEIGHHIDQTLGLGREWLQKFRSELMAVNEDRINQLAAVGKEHYAKSTEEQIAEFFGTLFTDPEKCRDLAPNAYVDAIEKLNGDKVLRKLVNFDFERNAKVTLEESLTKMIEADIYWHPGMVPALKIFFDERKQGKVLGAWENFSQSLKFLKLYLGVFYHQFQLYEQGVGDIKWAQKGFAPVRELNLFTALWKGMVKGNQFAVDHPELSKKWAKYLLSMGTTEDYNVYRVDRMLDGAISKCKEKNIKLVPEFVKFLKGIKDVQSRYLFGYIQDGLKLYAAESHAAREGLTPSDPNYNKKMLEIARLVNEGYGGQNWATLHISPALLQGLQNVFLAPDYNYGQIRANLAWTGLGAMYKENRGLRRRMAVRTAIKSAIFLGLGYNLLNALFRRKDREEHPEFYQDKDYDIFDDTVFGNTTGHKSHIFIGRNEDGTERYLRIGKQFREGVEFFYNFKEERLNTPIEFAQKVGTKVAPALQLIAIATTGKNFSGFEARTLSKSNEYWPQAIGFFKTMALEAMPITLTRALDDSSEWSWTDLAMNKSRGMSYTKAKEWFKKAISEKDRDLFTDIYYDAVRNGLDPVDILSQSISEIKAQAHREYGRQINSIEQAMDMRDKATNPDDKRYLSSRIRRMLKEKRNLENFNKMYDITADKFNNFISEQTEGPNRIKNIRRVPVASPGFSRDVTSRLEALR
ncbi:MAG: DEAD/DEAH box helicase family protein [Candidatus Omnitrophica bacterium]|nr:DEAD/DEAH box helicase family protein [Candidatus Omnitrophota bacterium]